MQEGSADAKVWRRVGACGHSVIAGGWVHAFQESFEVQYWSNEPLRISKYPSCMMIEELAWVMLELASRISFK